MRVSLRSKSGKKKKKEGEDDDQQLLVERRKNSDDEEDEIFDRTKLHTFNKKKAFTTSDLVGKDGQVETYETIKTKLESLIRERIKVTEEMLNKSNVPS